MVDCYRTHLAQTTDQKRALVEKRLAKTIPQVFPELETEQEEEVVKLDESDKDGDSFPAYKDCDDADKQIFPGANDYVDDGIDQNCDGVDGIDGDGDGAAWDHYGGKDCNDADASVHPGAKDKLGDDVDQDCDGIDGTDADGDWHVAASSGGPDCDDEDSAVHPEARDYLGDGVDQNCDGADGVDADGDGYASASLGGVDCDDNDPELRPGTVDAFGDGIDQNCDGCDGIDADGDGFASRRSGGDDPDDSDPHVPYDAAAELAALFRDRHALTIGLRGSVGLDQSAERFYLPFGGEAVVAHHISERLALRLNTRFMRTREEWADVLEPWYSDDAPAAGYDYGMWSLHEIAMVTRDLGRSASLSPLYLGVGAGLGCGLLNDKQDINAPLLGGLSIALELLVGFSPHLGKGWHLPIELVSSYYGTPAYRMPTYTGRQSGLRPHSVLLVALAVGVEK